MFAAASPIPSRRKSSSKGNNGKKSNNRSRSRSRSGKKDKQKQKKKSSSKKQKKREKLIDDIVKKVSRKSRSGGRRRRSSRSRERLRTRIAICACGNPAPHTHDQRVPPVTPAVISTVASGEPSTCTCTCGGKLANVQLAGVSTASPAPAAAPPAAAAPAAAAPATDAGDDHKHDKYGNTDTKPIQLDAVRTIITHVLQEAINTGSITMDTGSVIATIADGHLAEITSEINNIK